MTYPETITTRFERHTSTGVRSGTCPVCGKKGQRQQTFGQTLNPYNRNPDGTPKSRLEVVAAVRRQAADWSKGEFAHEKCRGRGPS